MRIIKHFIIVALLSFSCNLFAQHNGVNINDSLKVDTTNAQKIIGKADTVVGKKSFSTIPKKAALYSSVIPGLGQLYNRQYWKIGVVYALLGTGTGFIIFENHEYNYWRTAFADLKNNPDITTVHGLNESQIQSQMDFYQKNRDVFALVTGIAYALQVMDAIVFSHLKDFDISPDIGLKVKPVAMPNNGIGLGLVMNFK